MANEITVTCALEVANGSLVDNMTSLSLTPNQSTAAMYCNTQAIGTSEEALVIGADISTPGWFFARNLDATNYVEIGTTGAVLGQLKPGEPFGPIRLAASVTLYAIADTAPCNLWYKVYDS